MFVDGDWIEKKDQDDNGSVRLIQLADVGAGFFLDKSNKHLTSSKAKELNCTYLYKGDILIARLGEPLCKACIFPYDGQFITAVDIAILRIGIKEVNPNYLVYLINSPWFKEQIKPYESGTTRKRISRKNLNKIDVALPSINEQNNVVEHIEKFLSQLDNAVEILKKTKQQLEVYRQAVLKEAFDLSLADCQLLSINDLLSKNRKGMTTGPFGTMIKKHDYQSSGVPMLGIENIGKEGFISVFKKFVSYEKAEELKSFELVGGDIIISRSGTVGEICEVPFSASGSLLSTNLMRISLNHDIIRNDYFIALFQSKGIVLDQVKELCKGSTRDFLNQTILKQIQFPVPTLSRQGYIIDLLNTKKQTIQPIDYYVSNSLQQAEALRQSILKQAFEGE